MTPEERDKILSEYWKKINGCIFSDSTHYEKLSDILNAMTDESENQIALRKIEEAADDIEQWIYEEVFDCQDNYLPKKIVKNIKLILKQQEEE